MLGRVISGELAKVNKASGRELFEAFKIHELEGIGYVIEIDANTYVNAMWSRVWVVGTTENLAGVSLDIIQPEYKPSSWGDKVDTRVEGIVSLASGASPQELFKRFHQTKLFYKHQFSSYTSMRNLYRSLPFITDRIRKTLTERGKDRAVIWNHEDTNPRIHRDSLYRNRVEERDGENIIVLDAE